MKQRYLLAMLMILSVLGTTLLPAAPAQAAGGRAEPQSGPPGTTFTFYMNGLGSSEPVGVWVIRPDGQTVQVPNSRQFSDPEGNLTWTWTIDELTPGGEWQAAARGDVTRTRIVVPFRVENDQGLEPPSSWFADPQSGPPGTSFTFVGRSPAFIPGEQIGSWFIRPDGSPLHIDRGQSVDPNGQIFRIWKAPEDSYGGNWIFRAVGISSGFNIDIPFRITDAPPPPPAPVFPLEVAPNSGAPGTIFFLVAGGYTPGELVSNWLVRPDGQSLDAASYTRANGQGVVTWQWITSPDTPSGMWQWWLRGTRTSGRKHVSFFVEGNNPIPQPPGIPPGSVEPASGPPDTPFLFRASGFNGGENIFFWLEDPNGMPFATHHQVQANNGGVVEWYWDAPFDAMPGKWTMVLRGKVSSIRVRIPFVVTPGQPTPEIANVDPAVGPPGTRFAFHANGFNSGEEVRLWADGPSGRYDIETITANRRGEAKWVWTAPDEILDGQWTMVALGFDSRLRRTINFVVDRGTPPPDEPFGVSPYAGPPGTTFTFYAEGYPKHELVGYWLTNPNGEAVRTMHQPEKETEQIHADVNGRVEISWTSPPDTQRGVWLLTMRPVNPDSIAEDITTTIQFIVE
jgi:hypothetical protein